MIERATGMLVWALGAAAPPGQPPKAPDAASMSRVHVLVIALGAVLLLLAWLLIVTVMRRALKSVGPESKNQKGTKTPKPSPWEQAGQRAQPMEDTKGRDAGGAAGEKP